MRLFQEVPQVYLHRDSVDFRKAINGLVLIIEGEMALSLYADALFLFCYKQRDKLKVVYWDETGFCLRYKRLEKAKFHWLLRGFDITRMQSHPPLNYVAV